MVNALATSSKIRCRRIDENDLDAIVELLSRGFPARRPSYWMAGLARMAASEPPQGYARFGYLMESEGIPVGVILQLYHERRDVGGIPRVYCNLSSWYVEPAFRGHATLLISIATRDRNVTYLNISPVKPTWPIVEAQGFHLFAKGQYFSCPALSRRGHDVRVMPFAARATTNFSLTESDDQILRDHEALGSLCLVCRGSGGDMPFIFIPFTIRAGRIRLPAVRLVYCRDMSQLAACAGALGRYLLPRGAIAIASDCDDDKPNVIGFYAWNWGRKYFKGLVTPRLGDLTYSELVVFGP
jgi:hypothetical protein